MPRNQSATGIATGIEGFLSVDRTWSTSPAIADVLRQFGVITQKLSKIPQLRLGVIDHGDYESRPYATRFDLTDNFRSIGEHLKGIKPEGGSGRGANYAQALRAARTANWAASKSRFLILVGDEIPRPANLYTGADAVDAYNELKLLAEMNVKVISVQLLGLHHATAWFKKASADTGGVYMQLDQMCHLPMVVTSVVLMEESPDAFGAYAREVEKQPGYTTNVEDVLDIIGNRPRATTRRKGARVPAGLEPIDPARFQMFKVNAGPEIMIRDFVVQMGLTFQKGRGFYLHDYRTEDVQADKEIVLKDQVTGVWYTGDQVRTMLGIGFTGTVSVQPNPLPGFDVWIQSNSVNRTLNRKGRETWFMYEVQGDDATNSAPTTAKTKPAKPKKPGTRVN